MTDWSGHLEEKTVHIKKNWKKKGTVWQTEDSNDQTYNQVYYSTQLVHKAPVLSNTHNM